MSFFGAYFGATISGIVVEPAPIPVPTPLPAVYFPTDPEFVDHISQALDRLCQQFRPD